MTVVFNIIIGDSGNQEAESRKECARGGALLPMTSHSQSKRCFNGSSERARIRLATFCSLNQAEGSPAVKNPERFFILL